MSEYDEIDNKEILNIVQEHIEKHKHRRYRNKHKVKIFSSSAEVYLIEEMKDAFTEIVDHVKRNCKTASSYNYKFYLSMFLDRINYKRSYFYYELHYVNLFENKTERQLIEIKEIFEESIKAFLDEYDIIELLKLKRRRVKKYEAENRIYDSEFKRYETAYVNSNISALNNLSKKNRLYRKLQKVKNCNF